jgi:hypothetical protein
MTFVLPALRARDETIVLIFTRGETIARHLWGHAAQTSLAVRAAHVRRASLR